MIARQSDTRLAGDCVCGKPVRWHRDEKNRQVSCEDAQPRELHDRLAAAVQQRRSSSVLTFPVGAR